MCVAWEKAIWKCPRSVSPFEKKFDCQKFKKFINLESLHLNGYITSHINDDVVTSLNKLKYLELGQQSTVSNAGLKKLTNLQHLNLKGNSKITNEGIKNLFSLTSLDLSKNNLITLECLKSLTNLSSLNLSENRSIDVQEVRHLELPNLKEIILNPYRNHHGHHHH